MDNVLERATMTSTTTNAAALKNGSRLQEIWDRHEKQWKRLDELEERIDESVMRKRRRLANLLDETSTHRESHLRLFVTHSHVDKKWKLVVEGLLLVGHLDHKSAAKVEQEAAEAAGVITKTTATDENAGSATAVPGTDSAAVASSTLGHSSLQQQPQQPVMIRSTDRTQYRGISEKEGDIPVEATRFTHFFDKMTVSFQTIHQPTEAAMSLLSPASKKSRSKSKRGKQQEEKAAAAERLRLLTPHEPSTVLEWKRQDSPDAHAFQVLYNEPPLPNDSSMTHSVVATISLYLRPGPEDRYQPSQKLAAAFFPQHAQEPLVRSSGTKKRKATSTPTKKSPEQDREIPTENHISVPHSLTMKEIVSAIFLYAQTKQLFDKEEKSVIINDKTLQNLFDAERMSFFELQQRLKSQELVTKVIPDDNPIVLTYIMAADTATDTTESSENSTSADSSNIMSFDTNISVPGLLHFRARELMRRIKRREFEYTSSRTKARNLLLAARGASEATVKTELEKAITESGYSVPVWLALAKAAPAGSEARAVAHVEARTSLLLERLQHHCRACKAAWNIVDACQGKMQQEETEEEGPRQESAGSGNQGEEE